VTDALVTNPQPTCFVAIPFRDPFDRYYSHVYAPGIEAAGHKPVRADDLFSAGDVIRQLAFEISAASIVLADITTPNANVYYEIGMAHAWGKPTVLISQTSDTVPFDLRGGRLLEYDKDDPYWGDELRTRLIRAILDTSEAPDDCLPSGIAAVLNTRRTVDSPSISGHSSWKTSIESQLSQLQRSIEVTTRRQTVNPEALAQAESARDMIRLLLKSGTPSHKVLDELISAGTSRLWATEAIKEVLTEDTLPARARTEQ
jgi:hypothetical protein